MEISLNTLSNVSTQMRHTERGKVADVSNGVAAVTPPKVNGGGVQKLKAPASFSFLGRIAGFRPYQDKELLSLALADGEEYGVEAPPENYQSELQCELACKLPDDLQLKGLVRVTGRFGVFAVEREVQQNFNNFGRGQKNQGPKMREYQNFRFVIESLETVKVS